MSYTDDKWKRHAEPAPKPFRASDLYNISECCWRKRRQPDDFSRTCSRFNTMRTKSFCSFLYLVDRYSQQIKVLDNRQ